MNISFAYLQILNHFSINPFYTVTQKECPSISIIYNSHFTKTISRILFVNTPHHSTTIKKNTFKHILDSPLVFSQEICTVGTGCCLSTDYDFQKNNWIRGQTITNTSFPSSFANKNSFFMGDCGDLTITECIFYCCYTSIDYGGGLLVEQYCVVILHNCIFDQCHSRRHGCGAVITKLFVVDANNEPHNELSKRSDIQYTCFSGCYSNNENGIGSALILGVEDATLFYTSAVDCPKEGTLKPYGAQFDIQAHTISSQYINSTGGNAIYTGALEYRNAAAGFFRFHTISQANCRYSIAFIHIDINSLKISSSNFVKNSVLSDVEYSCPSLIFVRKKDALIQNCYFIDNNYGINGKFVEKENEDNIHISLVDCYADTNDSIRWNFDYIMTSNCNFNDLNVNTYPLRFVKLGNCEGEVPPGPIIITDFFTPSSCFSQSQDFIASSDFTNSQEFSKSSYFSKSSPFTKSNNFNQTNTFTPSKTLTNSQFFSKSDEFSHSNYFSHSLQFSKSNVFSCSAAFSESQNFLATEAFNSTIQFSPSLIFSKSTDFTPSLDKYLVKSPFLSSSHFSTSKDFTNVVSFEITSSQSRFGGKITIFNSHSLSYLLRKSVSLSISYSLTGSYSLTYNKDIVGYSNIFFTSNVNVLLPYVIYYYTQTYVQVKVIQQIESNKEKITAEQLIGIVCGSVAAFFIVLGIIILSLRKKNHKMYSDDLDYSSSENEIVTQTTIENQVIFDVQIKQDILDNWL